MPPPAPKDTLETGFLDGLIGYGLRRAYLPIAKDFAETLADLDLGPVQFTILALIEANPGSSQNAIAQAIAVKRPNFVALIDGLEARGLAERRPSPVDRRTHALHLTDAGVQLMAEARPRILAHEAKFRAVMRLDELALLLDLLGRLRTIAPGGEEA